MNQAATGKTYLDGLPAQAGAAGTEYLTAKNAEVAKIRNPGFNIPLSACNQSALVSCE
jgi:hypothetical protein